MELTEVELLVKLEDRLAMVIHPDKDYETRAPMGMSKHSVVRVDMGVGGPTDGFMVDVWDGYDIGNIEYFWWYGSDEGRIDLGADEYEKVKAYLQPYIEGFLEGGMTENY